MCLRFISKIAVDFIGTKNEIVAARILRQLQALVIEHPPAGIMRIAEEEKLNPVIDSSFHRFPVDPQRSPSRTIGLLLDV